MVQIALKVVKGLLLSGMLYPAFCAYAVEDIPLETKPVRIAISRQMLSVIAILAAQKNMFSSQGVAAEISYGESGKRSLDRLLRDEVDVVIGVSEVPVVLAGLKGVPLSILGALGGDTVSRKIIARRSAGIKNPEDLAGKKIATQEESALHFFLEFFLNAHGLSDHDINLSFMRVEDLPQALHDGRVSAIVIREPYLSQAENLLGADAITFDLEFVYFSYEFIVSRPSYVENNPQVFSGIFRVLQQAKRYLQENPETAFGEAADFLEIRESELRVKEQHKKWDIFLDRSVYMALEDVARWAIRQKIVAPQKIPNYQYVVNPVFLKQSKPKPERF